MLFRTLFTSNRSQASLTRFLQPTFINYSIKNVSHYHCYSRNTIVKPIPQLVNKYDKIIKCCKFHTTRRLYIPPSFALLIRPLTRVGAFIFGRLFKRWWRKKSQEEKDVYIKWFSARKRKLYGALGLTLAGFIYFYLSHIETDPLTGRSKFIILNKEQQKVLSDMTVDAHLDIHEDAILPSTHPAYRRLTKIIHKLITANKDIPSIAERHWTLTVIDSQETNAFVLPGGNIFVFLGALKMVDNDDQLALILAHEIAHVILLHSIETVSHNFLLDILLFVPLALTWAAIPSDILAYLFQFLGLSLTTIFLTLPYSRTLEKEADDIGLRLASRACIDIREVVVFWAMMKRLTELTGQTEIEWLSTHPVHEDRETYLNSKLPEAIDLRLKSGCWSLSRSDPVANFYAKTHKQHLKSFTEKGLIDVMA